MTVRDEERRSALAKLVVGGVGVIIAALSGLFGVAATPRIAATTRRWRRAASMFDLSASGPTPVILSDRHQDGWYETRQQTAIFIDKDGDTGYRALSATCTHLGCRVQWDTNAKHFLCPCHGGIYDRDGHVVSGPPPRPLDRIDARLNETTGDIEVQL